MDGLTERLVQNFGTSFAETEKIAFSSKKRSAQSSYKIQNTGTQLPILGATVTIVRDKEIETIDLTFKIELGQDI